MIKRFNDKIALVIILLFSANLFAETRTPGVQIIRSPLMYSYLNQGNQKHFELYYNWEYSSSDHFITEGGNVFSRESYSTLPFLRIGAGRKVSERMFFSLESSWEWIPFEVGLYLNVQYDFYQWSSGKLSVGIMYGGLFFVKSPRFGIQFLATQTVLQRKKTRLNVFSSLQLQRSTIEVRAVKDIGGNSIINDSFIYLNRFVPLVGLDILHEKSSQLSIGSRFSLGWEHDINWQATHDRAGTVYQRSDGMIFQIIGYCNF